ncbi:MAG: hypothetical protein ACNS62_24110 [Candidatus Cyclobacteriaceae bacterium M3_2C_046]
MKISRHNKDGLHVSATLVSPFTPTDNLGQEALIKTQITPLFYLIILYSNNTSQDLSGRVNVGLNKIPYDPARKSRLRSWKLWQKNRSAAIQGYRCFPNLPVSGQYG